MNKIADDNKQRGNAEIKPDLARGAARDTTDNAPGSEEKVLVDQRKSDLEGASSIVQGIGHQLRAGRIKYSMSIEDVSRHLHLSQRQVDAMEREDFGKLPGRTFLRGFIRNYAKLVHLDAASILRLLPLPAATNSISNTPYQVTELTSSTNLKWSGDDLRPGRNNPFLLKVVAFVFLLFVVFVVFRFGGWGQVSQMADELEIGIISDIDIGSSEQMLIELKLPPPILNTDRLNTNPSSLPSKILPSISLADSKRGILHFKFDRESWAQVIDGANKLIFKQINAEGTEQVLSGKRPLTIVIGKAANVSLLYNDKLIDLTPYTNNKNGVARLTLK